jgi:hypothetical protein
MKNATTAYNVAYARFKDLPVQNVTKSLGSIRELQAGYINKYFGYNSLK